MQTRDNILDYIRGLFSFAPEITRVAADVPHLDGLPFPTKHAIEEIALPITWVRSVAGDVVISFRDRPIRRVSKLDLTEIENGCFSAHYAFNIARREAQRRGILPENDIEVCVRLWLEDTPTLGLARSDPPEYFALTNMGSIVVPMEDGLTPEAVLETGVPLSLERHSLSKVWSNRWTGNEAEDAWKAFRSSCWQETRTLGPEAPYSMTVEV